MIKLADGKYAIHNNNGILEVYRHGERWSNKEKDLIGDNLVLSLVEMIERLKCCANCKHSDIEYDSVYCQKYNSSHCKTYYHEAKEDYWEQG